MAATMTKRQEKSRTNYNAVLDTSIVLFNKKGYKDTTIKDICEATTIFSVTRMTFCGIFTSGISTYPSDSRRI